MECEECAVGKVRLIQFILNALGHVDGAGLEDREREVWKETGVTDSHL